MTSSYLKLVHAMRLLKTPVTSQCFQDPTWSDPAYSSINFLCPFPPLPFSVPATVTFSFMDSPGWFLPQAFAFASHCWEALAGPSLAASLPSFRSLQRGLPWPLPSLFLLNFFLSFSDIVGHIYLFISTICFYPLKFTHHEGRDVVSLGHTTTLPPTDPGTHKALGKDFWVNARTIPFAEGRTTLYNTSYHPLNYSNKN